MEVCVCVVSKLQIYKFVLWTTKCFKFIILLNTKLKFKVPFNVKFKFIFSKSIHFKNCQRYKFLDLLWNFNKVWMSWEEIEIELVNIMKITHLGMKTHVPITQSGKCKDSYKSPSVFMISTVSSSLKHNLLWFWIFNHFLEFLHLWLQKTTYQIHFSFTNSLQSLAFPSWKSCSTLQISFSLLLLRLLLLLCPTAAVLQPTPSFCSINASPNSLPCSGSTVNLRIPFLVLGFYFWGVLMNFFCVDMVLSVLLLL